MPDSLLASIISGSVTVPVFLICTAVSLVLGLAVAAMFMYKSTYSKGFIVTLALLPAIVQVVIMLVNGNIGTGVAVAGAFSLVRFRSVAGGAREICCIFLAMAIGLATGMGYIGIAVLFIIIVGAALLILSAVKFGEPDERSQELKITIPENLDYSGIFDDIFDKYLKSAKLCRVKTTNLGTLYELDYNIVLREPTISKAFLDELRCRNGNLTIICGRKPTNHEEL